LVEQLRFGWGLDIEFQVAGDLHPLRRRSYRKQPFTVELGLGKEELHVIKDTRQ